MSPEQASGLATVDHRTDVYSLGITLYELLTLRPAFDEQDRSRLLKQLLEQDPKAPRRWQPALPRDLETIVLHAIRKDPTDRYPSAQLLADDLKRFLAGKPLLTRRQSWAEYGWRWALRNRLITSLTMIAFACLLAVIAVFVFSTH